MNLHEQHLSDGPVDTAAVVRELRSRMTSIRWSPSSTAARATDERWSRLPDAARSCRSKSR